MPRTRSFTQAIEAGELAPEYKFRTDAVVRNRGLLKARNVRLLSGGGWQRRWGTRRKVEHPGQVRYETVGVGESRALLFAFTPGRLDIYRDDWSLLQSITEGCPWTSFDLDSMQMAAEQNRVTVTSALFYPHEIIQSGTTWAVTAKTFTPGQNGALLQPYYRFHLPGTALIPSAVSGNITVTTTVPHWKPEHVNTRVRYQGVEIVLTNFVSTTQMQGVVLGTLFPTLIVPVDSTGGFQNGDVVEGSESKARGVVISVDSSSQLTILMTGGYEYFQSSPAEKLIGPTNRVTLTGAPAAASAPAGATDWDEQLISTARGFPAACAYHRGRQILADFPEAPNLICASSPGDPDDYDVGEGGPADAVIETVARDDTLRIRYLASFEQLLVFTDAGSYYVPETVGAPFSPTNAEFLKIGPEAIGMAPPVQVSEGMLFCENRSGRLLVCVPTGQVRRSWEIADLSELSYHLMGEPKKIAVLPATRLSDREIVLLKTDGTLAWMRYRRGQEVAGWCPWDTAGAWVAMTVVDGRLFLASRRQAGGVKHWGEELDPTATLDGCAASTGATWPHLANTTVTVTKDRQALWIGTLNGAGQTSESALWWGQVDAGFDYPVTAEYPPPIDGENGQWRPWQIIRAFVQARDSGTFRIEGRDFGAFLPNSTEDASPPLWSGIREEWIAGFAWDRTVTISQVTAAPLTIEAVTLEVKS